MHSRSDKRNTQIRLGAMGDFNPFPQTAALQDLHEGHDRASDNRSVLRRGAVNTTNALKSRVKGPESVRPESVKHESPWRSYDKNYELRLGVGDRVTVAERKEPLDGVVTVRSFSAYNAEEKLRVLHRIKHENFVPVLEVFSSEDSFHIVFEHMPICLGHFAGILKYPNELQLASILGQVSLMFVHCHTFLSWRAPIGQRSSVTLTLVTCCHLRQDMG